MVGKDQIACKISWLNGLLDFLFFIFQLSIKNFKSNTSRIEVLDNSLIAFSQLNDVQEM